MHTKTPSSVNAERDHHNEGKNAFNSERPLDVKPTEKGKIATSISLNNADFVAQVV